MKVDFKTVFDFLKDRAQKNIDESKELTSERLRGEKLAAAQALLDATHALDELF